MTLEELSEKCISEFKAALRLSLFYRHVKTAERQYGGWLWAHTDDFSHYACLWGRKEFDRLNIHSKLQDAVEELGGEYLYHDEDTGVFVRWSTCNPKGSGAV